MDDKIKHSIAVFPFLKTSAPASIGGITFRSTDDLTGLSVDDSVFVKEISEMLFLQNNLRIKSASYALVPFVDLERTPAPSVLAELRHIQAVVAYCYATAFNVFGDPFLNYEHASIAIFSPGRVSIFLVKPEHHTQETEANPTLTPDEYGFIDGYYGLYNFKQPFWAAKGSRLYPPLPNIGLNISQNLSGDMERYFDRPQYHLLQRLTKSTLSPVDERILTGLNWFNAANSLLISEEAAIVNLSIAFESLLGLPDDAKTERLIDAVSLLLGRLPRLDIWVHQFYEVRSEIVHEGKAQSLRFVASDVRKKTSADLPTYRPLLLYGRQIFQFCVATLLFGASLSEQGGLKEKFVTNQERFIEICRILDSDSIDAKERFASVAENVIAADRYRFVQESGLTIEALLGAARAATKVLFHCDPPADGPLKSSLLQLLTAKRSHDNFELLDAIHQVIETRKELSGTSSDSSTTAPIAVTLRIIEIVWGYSFMHYFWVKKNREK